MDANLELARTKVTVRYLAENLDVAGAEKLLHCLRESSAFLERRIAREKNLEHKNGIMVRYVDGGENN